MSIVSRVAEAMKQFFGPLATDTAKVSQVILRRRKFTPRSLAPTFVLGCLQTPTRPTRS